MFTCMFKKRTAVFVTIPYNSMITVAWGKKDHGPLQADSEINSHLNRCGHSETLRVVRTADGAQTLRLTAPPLGGPPAGARVPSRTSPLVLAPPKAKQNSLTGATRRE